MNYYNENGRIISIDIKNYSQNWFIGQELCKNCYSPDESPLWNKFVKFYQGSTIDPLILEIVGKHVNESKVIFVSQDSSHNGLFVYNELSAYSKFVSVGSYIIVQDTELDRMRRRVNGSISGCIDKFISENNNFEINRDVENLFFFTQHPKGYIKRVK
jgi:cephalosporin hydroxylase